MCIRDRRRCPLDRRHGSSPAGSPRPKRCAGRCPTRPGVAGQEAHGRPVSYTHLTLPTICSV
eukprot:13639695-Alexandrium_andersonii.AAC.1